MKGIKLDAVYSSSLSRARRTAELAMGWKILSNRLKIFSKFVGVKESIYHIGIEIDRLTNSITNTISGGSYFPLANRERTFQLWQAEIV